ncbi:uncharacterized protein [Aegilops tauschii subsp. strangulata]|uniref:uncharacterized protein n=1 Tax=Aegilops tauschii subsp. strangulata TaxID=200361 RepID=UPI003CC8436E
MRRMFDSQMTQRQQRFCSLSFFYARHYPQNVVRCGHQTTVFRMPRSETEATRAALTCVSLTFAEVVINAITAGAVNYRPVGLALGRWTFATQTAADRRPAVLQHRPQRDVC